jgi:hypothetical protein
MQAQLKQAKTLIKLPFVVDDFRGYGVWADHQRGQRTYQAELTIFTEESGATRHIVNRVFLQGDGDALDQEYSCVEFTASADSFFEVAIRFEGKEYRGHGYCLGNRYHYEITLADGARLETTYILNREHIQLLGSYAKNGNLTAWAETLTGRR